jgi:hypothetical protein
VVHGRRATKGLIGEVIQLTQKKPPDLANNTDEKILKKNVYTQFFQQNSMHKIEAIFPKESVPPPKKI